MWGRSSEHEISCISAGGILAGIDRTLYEPVLIGITQQGDWVLLPNDYALSIVNGALPHVDPSAPAVVAGIAGLSSEGKNLDIDIIFLCFMVPMVKMELSKVFARWQILPTLEVAYWPRLLRWINHLQSQYSLPLESKLLKDLWSLKKNGLKIRVHVLENCNTWLPSICETSTRWLQSWNA